MNNITELIKSYPERIIFQCISGSHAYGTNHDSSDRDIKGVFVMPMIEHFSLDEPVKQVTDERHDTVYYNLKRLLELLARSNPNVLEMLYTPEDCIMVDSRYMRTLREHRSSFISQKAYETFVGYAHSQVKKAKGRNKWINNPQPEASPSPEDFCRVVPADKMTAVKPFRPVPLTQTSIDLGQCHATSVEHAENTYRLYKIGPSARAVFRNGHLVCEHLSLEDEQKFCGLPALQQTRL